MKVLDTNTLTHLFRGHARVVEKYHQETDIIATTIISRIEVLQGRFAMLLKAADGGELQRAQERLDQTFEQLSDVPNVLSIDETAADRFDQLRQHRRLKKIGRADLLIAAITLASGATLVTRNVKDFALVPGLRVENWID